MQLITLSAVPSQTLAVQVSGQNCQLNVYQKSTGLFMDIVNNGTLTIGGVICEDRNRIIRNAYLGFLGDFAFADLLGREDPVYTGLGTRFVLVYLEPADVPEDAP